ncbi:hypothetical protein [[Clostridium] fimetarium]|uniref:Uncharacterized protein n=1 Tax=[Clostridium] fimetarium TaxID=99656 RepID=A0A1I0NEM2_9FIRM|nr:hypothetical protein [[Clostridium] fimetarium]SEV99574.1 hypothetical protein SAMN05421659_10335 [[Clostridium] fimetarium]
MRIIRCRKCKQRLFDIEDDDCRKIAIKYEDKKPVHIDFSRVSKDSVNSRDDFLRHGFNVTYHPATTSVEYACPRCKLKFLISLHTGRMKEIVTK